MSDSTHSKLHVHGHSPSDLISRVSDAATFRNGMTSTQASGIERAMQLASFSSSELTAEHLVEKFFHLFDDLFFERSLRYVVTPKIERGTSAVNTCCKGLAHGGRLPVMLDDTSSSLKAGVLGRLLHDMIHAYLWRYGFRSFTYDKLFEHGWGFSGHGAAWQDIAAVLEKSMKEHELPLDLGRNEALRTEFESFARKMDALKNEQKPFGKGVEMIPKDTEGSKASNEDQLELRGKSNSGSQGSITSEPQQLK